MRPVIVEVAPRIADVTVEVVILAGAEAPVTPTTPVERTFAVDSAVLVASASTVKLRPAVTAPSHCACVGEEMLASGALTATPPRIPPVMTFE